MSSWRIFIVSQIFSKIEICTSLTIAEKAKEISAWIVIEPEPNESQFRRKILYIEKEKL